MRVVAVTCPGCGLEFFIDLEFLSVPKAYCHCPRCAREFKPQESRTPPRS